MPRQPTVKEILENLQLLVDYHHYDAWENGGIGANTTFTSVFDEP